MNEVRKNTGILTAVTAVAFLLAVPVARAVILDDFSGSMLDTNVWEDLGVNGAKSHTVSGGLLTWADDGGDWGTGEICSQQAFLLPPPGQTSVVTWTLGPAAVTGDTGNRSVRFQIGLVSANETAPSRQHYDNSSGGIWLDGTELLTANTTQVGVDSLAANDGKGAGSNGTYINSLVNVPWNWTSATTAFQVEITSDNFTWYHNGALMGTYAWADWGIDAEFSNGFRIMAMGQNWSGGRGTISVDQVEIDNPVTGAGLIVSFAANPPNVVGGEPSSLEFEVDPAATVDIQPGIGAVTHSNGIGSVEIVTSAVDSPTTTVYTLTATVLTDMETRETSLTVYPVPEIPLADFEEPFDGTNLNAVLWETLGQNDMAVSNSYLNISTNGGNWNFGQIISAASYKIPGPGETTRIDFELGPARITVDNGADQNSIRYQVGVVSANETSGYSFEHYQNTSGGTWLDFTDIRSGTTDGMAGAAYYANDGKTNTGNATSAGGVGIGWDWQNTDHVVSVVLTEGGFTWYNDDGSVLAAPVSWAEAGITTEFLNGFRIMAAGMNYSEGRGFMSCQSINAASESGTFSVTEIARTAGGVEVAWETEDGATYTVRRAGMITDAAPWPAISGELSDTNRFEDTAPPAGQAFYLVDKTPPPPLLYAGFEPGEDLSGWREIMHQGSPSAWAVGAPTSGPMAAYAGSNVAATVLGGDYDIYSDAGWQTPVIDLTGASSATLSFQQWYAFPSDPLDTDEARIHVLDENGDPLTMEPVAVYSGSSGGWVSATVPLPVTALGQPIRLEFYLYTDSLDQAPGWYIDEVEVK